MRDVKKKGEEKEDSVVREVLRPYLRLNIFAFLQNCSFGPGTVILSKFVRHSLNTTGSPTESRLQNGLIRARASEPRWTIWARHYFSLNNLEHFTNKNSHLYPTR